jgi:hypothetical protein
LYMVRVNFCDAEPAVQPCSCSCTPAELEPPGIVRQRPVLLRSSRVTVESALNCSCHSAVLVVSVLTMASR